MNDNLIKRIDLARAEKIDAYPVFTDCRAEIERLTAEREERIDKWMELIEEKDERIAKLEAALLECTLNHDEAHYIAQQALETDGCVSVPFSMYRAYTGVSDE